MSMRVFPLLALALLLGCQPPAGQAPIATSPTGPVQPDTPSIASPVGIDLEDVPLAVLAGLPVRLPVRLDGTGAVRWRLDDADRGRAEVSSDGVFIGREPGPVVVLAEAEGQTAAARIAVAPAEGPSARLEMGGYTRLADDGFHVVTDAVTWARLWSDLKATQPDVFRWGPPEVNFDLQAVLLFSTGVNPEGGRLAAPEPIIATMAPRIEVDFPERRNVYRKPPVGHGVTLHTTFLWRIPRDAVGREVVATRWGRVTLERGVPAPWVPPPERPVPVLPAPSLAPAPSASAPDPDGPVGGSIGGRTAISPEAPCLGSEVTYTFTSMHRSPVSLLLRSYAPYRLSVGSVPPSPTDARTLGMFPVDETGRAAFRFALPPADATGWPFRLEPKGSYELWYSQGGVGGSTQLPICGWSPRP